MVFFHSYVSLPEGIWENKEAMFQSPPTNYRDDQCSVFVADPTGSDSPDLVTLRYGVISTVWALLCPVVSDSFRLLTAMPCYAPVKMDILIN